MRLHQTTIKDIAKILNISASTVSRALKDHPDISEETKEAVRRVANSVNYRPNALALSLRKAKSNIIGIVVPEMSHHFFSSVLSGMDAEASARGYNSMICQSCESATRELQAVQTLVDTRVDGLLISLSKQTSDTSFLSNVANDGLPIVMFDRVATSLDVSRVTTDDYQGAHDAVELMISHGKKHIALLCGPDEITVCHNRRKGYESALREAGLEIDETLMIEADTAEKVNINRNRITDLANRIDGLFAINDMTAISAMKILIEAGRRVPDDLEVVGFGDDPVAQVATPSLTSVEQNGYEIGRQSMHILIDQIEQGLIVTKPDVRVLTPSITTRQSCPGASPQ